MDFKNKVKRAKKGDEEAFIFLMNECKERLYRTAYSYVKDESLALDIVQETVYKAYISIEKLKKVEYFTTWITRILINNALDVVKKNNKVVYLADKQFFENIEDKEKINSEEKICLWEAIDSLEEKHREVIVLKYFNDMTVTEIAELLSYPVGTVKTYLNKGLVGVITTGIGITNPEFVSAIPGLNKIIGDVSKDRFSEDSQSYADKAKVVGTSVIDKGISATFEELVYDENNIIGSFVFRGEDLKKIKDGISSADAYLIVGGKDIIAQSSVEMKDPTTAVVIFKADIGKENLSDNANIKFDITGLYNGYKGIKGKWEFTTNADKTKGKRVFVDKKIETKAGSFTAKEVSMTDVSTTIVIDGQSKVPDEFDLQGVNFAVTDDKGKVYDVTDLDNGQNTKTGKVERVISVNGNLTHAKYINISEKVGGKVVHKEIEGIYPALLQFNGDGKFETKIITRKPTKEELDAGYGVENVNIYANISNDFKPLSEIKSEKIEVSKGQYVEVQDIKNTDKGTEFVFKTDGLYNPNNLTQLQVFDDKMFDYQRGEDRMSGLKTIDKNNHIYSVTIGRLDLNKKYTIGIPKVTPMEKSGFDVKIDLNN